MHALLSRLRHLNCSTRRLRCIFADSTIPPTWCAPEIDIYVYVGLYFLFFYRVIVETEALKKYLPKLLYYQLLTN